MRATSPISVPQGDPYIRRIVGLCDMHRIPVGSPAELEGFLTALDENKHLAMDFWSVMGKMSEEGSAYLAGRTLNARMLEVVVEAVTGLSVAEILASGEKPRQVVAQMVRLLAGEDIHSPVVVDDQPGVDAAAPDVEVRKPVARESVVGPAVGSSAATPLRPVEVRPLNPAGGVEEERTSPKEGGRGTTLRWPFEPVTTEQQQPVQQPFNPPREIARTGGPQSLGQARAVFSSDSPLTKPAANDEEELERLRLVHWVLENFPAAQGGAAARAEADYYGTKLNAAEIFARYAEQRSQSQQSAVEKGIAEKAVPERPAVSGSAVDRADAATVILPRLSEGSAEQNGRMVLEPQAEILPGKAHLDDASIRVPMSSFEDDEEEINRQRKVFTIVLSGIVAVGIVVGLLLAQVHVVEAWRRLDLALHNDLMGISSERRSTLDIPNERVVDPEPAPPQAAPSAPVRRVVRPPVPQPRAAAPAPALVASAPRPTYSGNVDRPVVRVYPAPVDRIDPLPAARAGAGAAYDPIPESSGGVTGPVQVPEALMAAKLISGQMPFYPEGSRANGRVVLQAIISKSGTVGHLRVLSGDPSLRGAASEAVAKWRYRPYTVGNEAVEVSTTVTVDFQKGQ